MKNNYAKFIIKAGLIAGMYVVATNLLAPISFSGNQVRISESLFILVYFTKSAIPGLFAGCFIANLASPFGIIDVIVGSSATLLACIFSSKIKNKFLLPIPNILINGIFVGYILYIMADLPFLIGMSSVMIGQAISLYLIGIPLIYFIEKNNKLKELIGD